MLFSSLSNPFVPNDGPYITPKLLHNTFFAGVNSNVGSDIVHWLGTRVLVQFLNLRNTELK